MIQDIAPHIFSNAYTHKCAENRTFKSTVWATFSILLSTGIQIAGTYAGITTLTAPFVVAVWITMGLQRLFSKK